MNELENFPRNNIYCPRCGNLIAHKDAFTSDAYGHDIHVFECTNRPECDWGIGIASKYPDGSDVPVLEELWRSIALEVLMKKEAKDLCLVQALGALKMCQKTFSEYAEIHKAKIPEFQPAVFPSPYADVEEKVKRNSDMAAMCGIIINALEEEVLHAKV